jgi:hypothetical protein
VVLSSPVSSFKRFYNSQCPFFVILCHHRGDGNDIKLAGKQLGHFLAFSGLTHHTTSSTNIISELQYLVARCFSSDVYDVFCLRSTCVCFPSARS